MQIIFHSPLCQDILNLPLEEMTRKQRNFIIAFHRFFFELANNPTGSIYPFELFHAFHWSQKQWFTQYDASEFMLALFDALKDATYGISITHPFQKTLEIVCKREISSPEECYQKIDSNIILPLFDSNKPFPQQIYDTMNYKTDKKTVRSHFIKLPDLLIIITDQHMPFPISPILNLSSEFFSTLESSSSNSSLNSPPNSSSKSPTHSSMNSQNSSNNSGLGSPTPSSDSILDLSDLNSFILSSDSNSDDCYCLTGITIHNGYWNKCNREGHYFDLIYSNHNNPNLYRWFIINDDKVCEYNSKDLKRATSSSITPSHNQVPTHPVRRTQSTTDISPDITTGKVWTYQKISSLKSKPATLNWPKYLPTGFGRYEPKKIKIITISAIENALNISGKGLGLFSGLKNLPSVIFELTDSIDDLKVKIAQRLTTSHFLIKNNHNNYNSIYTSNQKTPGSNQAINPHYLYLYCVSKDGLIINNLISPTDTFVSSTIFVDYYPTGIYEHYFVFWETMSEEGVISFNGIKRIPKDSIRYINIIDYPHVYLDTYNHKIAEKPLSCTITCPIGSLLIYSPLPFSSPYITRLNGVLLTMCDLDTGYKFQLRVNLKSSVQSLYRIIIDKIRLNEDEQSLFLFPLQFEQYPVPKLLFPDNTSILNSLFCNKKKDFFYTGIGYKVLNIASFDTDPKNIIPYYQCPIVSYPIDLSSFHRIDPVLDILILWKKWKFRNFLNNFDDKYLTPEFYSLESSFSLTKITLPSQKSGILYMTYNGVTEKNDEEEEEEEFEEEDGEEEEEEFEEEEDGKSQEGKKDDNENIHDDDENIHQNDENIHQNNEEKVDTSEEKKETRKKKKETSKKKKETSDEKKEINEKKKETSDEKIDEANDIRIVQCWQGIEVGMRRIIEAGCPILVQIPNAILDNISSNIEPLTEMMRVIFNVPAGEEVKLVKIVVNNLHQKYEPLENWKNDDDQLVIIRPSLKAKRIKPVINLELLDKKMYMYY